MPVVSPLGDGICEEAPPGRRGRETTGGRRRRRRRPRRLCGQPRLGRAAAAARLTARVGRDALDQEQDRGAREIRAGSRRDRGVRSAPTPRACATGSGCRLANGGARENPRRGGLETTDISRRNSKRAIYRLFPRPPPRPPFPPRPPPGNTPPIPRRFGFFSPRPLSVHVCSAGPSGPSPPGSPPRLRARTDSRRPARRFETQLLVPGDARLLARARRLLRGALRQGQVEDTSRLPSRNAAAWRSSFAAYIFTFATAADRRRARVAPRRPRRPPPPPPRSRRVRDRRRRRSRGRSAPRASLRARAW